MPDRARRKLVAATREVIDAVAHTGIDPVPCDDALAAVEDAVRLLRAHRFAREDLAGTDLERDHFMVFSPFTGSHSPLAVPIRMKVLDDGSIDGTVTYPRAYQGSPGCVHGGFIAGGFDEVLGYAQALTATPGMTGKLNISYRSPTPLYQQLRYRAWVERIDGRKIHVRGELRVVADDRLCAEASGLFVALRRGATLGPSPSE